MSEVSDTEDEDHTDSEEDDWLTKKLPNLPHFHAVLPKISHLLLQACLVETNLRSLLSFILFLTTHIPRDLVFEFSIGISQIVVDRFSIIKKVFRPRWSSSEERRMGRSADTMLSCLLSMLRSSMEMAIQSQRMWQLSRSRDFLTVEFASGKKSTFHVALIHATFLLLTCPAPSQSTDFNFLMDMWFPTKGQNPVACTVESKEEVPLVTPAILPHMLCSENTCVLGVSLESASPSQLCSSLEHFGVPLKNVEQLLKRLDGLCEAGEEVKLEDSIERPTQLAELVEVQLMRGVSSGMVFLALLRKMGSLPDEPIRSISEVVCGSELQEMEMCPVSPFAAEMVSLPQLPAEKMEQLLLQMFAPSLCRSSLPPEEVKEHMSDIEQALKRMIQSLISRSSKNHEPNTQLPVLITALHKLVASGNARTRRQVFEGMVKRSFAITLLRLITKIQQLQADNDLSTNLFHATIKQILWALGSLKLVKPKQFPQFQAAVKSCAHQLGLNVPADREHSTEKVAKVVRDCTTGIYKEEDILSKEQAMMIGDICRCVGIEKQSPLVENILRCLVQQSISLGQEGKCIEFLQKLEWLSRPVALHCSPPVLQYPLPEKPGKGEGERGESAVARESGHVSSHLPLVSTLDMSGLKVDLLELLDPEILSVCPKVAQSEVFRCRSGDEDGGSGPPKSPGGLPGGVCGSSYLLARLVHESSWSTLHSTVTSLLTTENHCDGYVSTYNNYIIIVPGEEWLVLYI